MITRRCIRIPIAWGFPLAVLGGIIAGLGLLTIYISNAFSYLSDKPKTCVNCHVMVPSYATWTHSSHREQAVCNDCHVPQLGRHPDHAAQAAAQQLVGLDMAKLAAAKRRFKKTLLPDWQERAAKRQRQWDNKQTEVSH